MSELIAGLPDAVALRCLARVPYHHFLKLELVCHSWKNAFRSPELFRVRREVGSSEELLCVCAYDPENLWQLYDPIRDIWVTLPVFPSKIRHLAHFGVVSTSGKLFVLGGGSNAVDPSTGDHVGQFATDEVWSYDPIIRKWALCACMRIPRAMFACCVFEGKIVVAGGFTSCRKSICEAEIYDPERDEWVPLPDLIQSHNSTCSGVVIKGKLHVLHTGLSPVQVLEGVGSEWEVVEDEWLHGPMTVIGDVKYVMRHGVVYKEGEVVGSGYDFRRRFGFAMVGLRGDVYVLGGLIEPDQLNWDIETMSDVVALNVRSERPTWRRVSSMTRCRGTIFGCASLIV